VPSSCSVDSADIAGKPPNWTGVPGNSEKELALVPGARLEARRLRHLHAFNTFFAKTNFTGADLTGAQLDYADLRGTIFHQNQAKGARFNSAFFGDQTEAHVPEEEEQLKEREAVDKGAFEQSYARWQKKYHLADLDLSDFSKAHFAQANLNRLKLQSCLFEGANFESSYLVHTDFLNCGFAGAIFNLATFEDAVFHPSSVGYSAPLTMIPPFGHVDLSGAIFTGGYGSRVRFLGCNLTAADFTRADLYKAIFAQCSVADALFDEADLSGADFGTAIDLTEDQLSRAKSLSGVILPSYLDGKLRPDVQHRINAKLVERKKTVLEMLPAPIASPPGE
jgi:fluoroquinolone resistance protein